ncbi:MAG: hypothetical protein KIT14_12390 [bacterium]|nr:hypothetical protein [bacterium]
MRTGRLVAAALLSTFAWTTAARAQHTGDMLIGSTAPGGGALALRYDFGRPVRATLSFTGPTTSLFTSTDPGWDLLVTPGDGLFPLPAGVPVTVEITAIDPDLSLKVGPSTLAAPGEFRLLGTTSAIHVHPSWQLVLANGTTGTRSVSFRLTTTSPSFAASASHTATVTNLPEPPPTTTSSTTSTTVAPGSTTTTSTTLVPPPAQRLGGKKLVAKDAADARKRMLGVVSTDPTLQLGAEDPRQASAAVRVRSAAAGIDLVFVLPAASWKPIGKPGSGRGWKYADKKLRAGAVQSLVLKPGKTLKIAAKGAGLALGLTHDPTPIQVELAIGAERWCLAFGGVVRFTTDRKLDARDAAAPAACAP